MNDFNIGDAVLFYVVFLFSTVLHELAHATMAYKWGDTTAADEGRLTLNPMAHIDPFGTVILPLLMLFMSGGRSLMGYATTPVNESRMRNPKWGGFWTSFAGPLANLAIAIVSVIALKFLQGGLGNAFGDYRDAVMTLFSMSVRLNLLLLVFNLLPIPPLDGGYMLRTLLPERFADLFNQIGMFGMFIVLALASSGFINTLVEPLYRIAASVLR